MGGPILVPLDGSALAEKALPYAQDLAGRTGRLLLLYAPQAREGEAHQGRLAGAYLAGVADHLRNEGVVESVVFAGDAASAILNEARLRNVALIVMATHGHTGLGRLRFGGVAEAVLRRSPAPVLLVRAWQAVAVQTAAQTPPRLVVPLDGSAFAEAALPFAVDLATRRDAGLVLVTAVPPQDAPFALDQSEERGAGSVQQRVDDARGYLLQQQVDDARGYLLQQRDRLLRDGFAGDIRIEAGVGLPSTVIEAVGRQHAATLVIMATHGRSGLARLVLGGTADSLLRQGSTPLVLVRPSALTGEAALPPPAGRALATSAPARER